MEMFTTRKKWEEKVRTIWFILIVEVINVVVSHVTAHFVMIEPALKYRFLTTQRFRTGKWKETVILSGEKKQ